MTRKTPPLSVPLAAAALSLALAASAPGPALAHQSFAMFDPTKLVTLEGVVKEFEWTNPHVGLTITTAPKGAAAAEDWAVELTSPGNLTRLGWTRRALKPGDHVLLDVHPLRDGQHGGLFKKVTLVGTGQVLTADRDTGDAFAK